MSFQEWDFKYLMEEAHNKSKVLVLTVEIEVEEWYQELQPGTGNADTSENS